MLLVSGGFLLDEAANPPPLKAITLDRDDSRSVTVGRGVTLRMDPNLTLADALLNARVVVNARRYRGLGSVVGGCAVLCASNYCRDWALRNRRPRMVAKVIGVLADEPTYVLLTQPKLKGASRSRRESTANRIEAGLVSFILIEPITVECPHCPGPNLGEVTLDTRSPSELTFLPPGTRL
jgi:hypothetical protein